MLTDTGVTQHSKTPKSATTHPEHYEEYDGRGEWRRLCDAHDAPRGSACSRPMDGSFQQRLGCENRRDEQQEAVCADVQRTAHTHVSMTM